MKIPNKDKILELMNYLIEIEKSGKIDEENIKDIVFNTLNSNKYAKEVKEVYEKINLEPIDKLKHIISGWYLNSITKKGEVAQEFSYIISSEYEKDPKAFKFNVPIYIKEMIEWIQK